MLDHLHWPLAIEVAEVFGGYPMKSGSGRLASWVEGTLSLPMVLLEDSLMDSGHPSLAYVQVGFATLNDE